MTDDDAKRVRQLEQILRTRQNQYRALEEELGRAAERARVADREAGRIEEAAAQMRERIRALHARLDLAPDGRTIVCGQCHDEDGGFVDWPCPTIQALDGER